MLHRLNERWATQKQQTELLENESFTGFLRQTLSGSTKNQSFLSRRKKQWRRRKGTSSWSSIPPLMTSLPLRETTVTFILPDLGMRPTQRGQTRRRSGRPSRITIRDDGSSAPFMPTDLDLIRGRWPALMSAVWVGRGVLRFLLAAYGSQEPLDWRFPLPPPFIYVHAIACASHR